jgi:hypothetical protein
MQCWLFLAFLFLFWGFRMFLGLLYGCLVNLVLRFVFLDTQLLTSSVYHLSQPATLRAPLLTKRLSLVLEQELPELHVPVQTCDMKRCLTGVIHCIYIGLVAEKNFSADNGAYFRSSVHCSGSVNWFLQSRKAVLQKISQSLMIILHHRHMDYWVVEVLCRPRIYSILGRAPGHSVPVSVIWTGAARAALCSWLFYLLVRWSILFLNGRLLLKFKFSFNFVFH